MIFIATEYEANDCVPEVAVPKATRSSKTTTKLKVGIFWYVDGMVLGESVTLDDAEPYGEALQHGGHHDFWQQLKASTPAEYSFKSHAYDFYPRGRMVWFFRKRVARLYLDKCLNEAERASVLRFFDAAGCPVEFELDSHYCCSICNAHYLDDL